jgi:hypothetical protein
MGLSIQSHKHLKITEGEWAAFCKDFDDTMARNSMCPRRSATNCLPSWKARRVISFAGKLRASDWRPKSQKEGIQ